MPLIMHGLVGLRRVGINGGWYNVYVCLFALKSDVDVIVGGRACDTAIFASLPALLEFPVGLAMHLAKIIECASLCCVSLWV
jgi:hypothetical protein